MEEAKQSCQFDLSPTTLNDLQKELYQWQKYNFGDQDNERVLMGIFEEAGELCHAHLKLAQGIRGSQEKHEAAMRDAIGDISIYMLNYLSGIDQRLPEFVARTDVEPTEDLVRIRKSVLSVFRLAGKIDVDDNLSVFRVKHLISGLLYLCALKGWDLEEIIRETWAKIGLRDWKRYPLTGFASQEPATVNVTSSLGATKNPSASSCAPCRERCKTSH